MVTCEKVLRGLRAAGTVAVGDGVRCKASVSPGAEVLRTAFCPCPFLPSPAALPAPGTEGQRGGIACLPC